MSMYWFMLIVSMRLIMINIASGLRTFLIAVNFSVLPKRF